MNRLTALFAAPAALTLLAGRLDWFWGLFAGACIVGLVIGRLTHDGRK